MEGEATFKTPFGSQTSKTWYKVIGDLKSGKTPLILLHGGPSACHEYLAVHDRLTKEHGIPIILYDQVGNGRSTHFRDRQGDENFWTVDLFCDELDNLIDHLGIRDQGYDILGQSWGGALAGEFAVRRPRGLRRLVLYSTTASIADLNKDIAMLMSRLPQEDQDAIRKHEKAGTTDSAEYRKSEELFLSRHMCRAGPFPHPDMMPGMKHMQDDPTVYTTMWGFSRQAVTGSLRNWSFKERLHLVDEPVLIINGVHDHININSHMGLFMGLKKVKWISFSDASHMAHLENPEQYWPVLTEFLLAENL